MLHTSNSLLSSETNENEVIKRARCLLMNLQLVSGTVVSPP